MLFRSNNGLVFYSINATDAMYHVSLIGNLMHHFPPTHGGLDGVALRGYHFFYDFLLANFSLSFATSSENSPTDIIARLENTGCSLRKFASKNVRNPIAINLEMNIVTSKATIKGMLF